MSKKRRKEEKKEKRRAEKTCQYIIPWHSSGKPSEDKDKEMK